MQRPVDHHDYAMMRGCKTIHPDPALTEASCRSCWLSRHVPAFHAIYDPELPMADDVYEAPPPMRRPDESATPPVAPPQPLEPGWWAKGWSFITAAGRFLASGAPLTDQAAYDARLAVCDGCEHYRREHGTCRLCGCVCAVKAAMKTQHCPARKWPGDA